MAHIHSEVIEVGQYLGYAIIFSHQEVDQKTRELLILRLPDCLNCHGNCSITLVISDA